MTRLSTLKSFENLTSIRRQSKTSNDIPNYTPPSMKASQLGRYVGARAFTTRNVFIKTRTNVQAVSSIRMASVRYQSSSKEPPRSLKWTEYHLNGATPSTPQASILSKASTGASAVRTAYIALGSNLGDRIQWIERACKEIEARGIKIKRTSCLWETKPMYVVDQESFINGACEACIRTFFARSASRYNDTDLESPPFYS